MGYEGLADLYRAAAAEARDRANDRPIACPVCGWAPLDERDGVQNCPAGDWNSTNGSA